MERFEKVIAARKPGSLKWWKDRKIEEQNAENFAANRSAILANPKNAEIKKTGQHRYWLELIPVNNTIDLGSAVPVAADGYFLTVAHNDLSRIFTWNERIELVTRKPRVVWKGRMEKGDPDLAVLHVPVKMPVIAGFSEAGSWSRGTRVLASGTGRLIRAQSGGRVVSVSDWKISPNGVRWREVIHSAPIVPGDSGGPLLDERGGLIGVHSLIHIGLLTHVWLGNRDCVFGCRGGAISPDPAWVEKIIKEDRERRRKRNQRRP